MGAYVIRAVQEKTTGSLPSAQGSLRKNLECSAQHIHPWINSWRLQICQEISPHFSIFVRKKESCQGGLNQTTTQLVSIAQIQVLPTMETKQPLIQLINISVLLVDTKFNS